jgi:hypothetical protein
MNSDQFRSQSMVTTPRPPLPVAPPGSINNIAPGHAFRHQQYNPASRITAQGRPVPERGDEHTLSMMNYAREHDHSQTGAGRVIPRAKRVSNDPTLPVDRNSFGTPTSPISPSSPESTTKQRTVSQGSLPSRSMSMASTVIAHPDRTDSMVISKQNGVATSGSQSQRPSARRTPLVYPALLSRVAEVFRERIPLADMEKDGLNYKNAFSGEDAVTLIAFIIKTTDRNLALLLGRSLDAQKFFHDVTYAHRLRDLRTEIYQFRETLPEEEPEVNGVFTLLTECYSPTCTRDRLCYSIACPRRLEQQARLKLKIQPGLKREPSHASLHEDQEQEQKLWINTVSKEVADSIDDREKKRQEVISELMYTERDFVKDLEYLRDFWMKPLQSSLSPIAEHRRRQFVQDVFSNVGEVFAVNSRLASALTQRQQQQPVVRNIGDIFLHHVPNFSPFITYGARQLFAKFRFENEKRTNPGFGKFVDETERLKESRKLELNGYLTKPTTRLARYPLLLENILKYTSDGNPDKTDIPKAIALVKDFLTKVNIESGKAENHFNLMQLSNELKFRPGEWVDLKLTEQNRQLIFKSTLKRNLADSQGDIQTFLFDHAVLLVRVKMVNKREELKVYRKPIPLELLVIDQMEQLLPRQGVPKRSSTNLIGARTQTMTNQNPREIATKGCPLTFRHLGKGGYDITLFCSTPIQQQKWIEHVDAQQQVLRDRNQIFTKTVLNEGFFTAIIKVNCGVPIDGGRKIVLGTDSGVYVFDRKKNASSKPYRVLECKNVSQVDVLEQHSIVLVLTDKTLYSYEMEALETEDANSAISKRGRKICHANFFKAGLCQGQQFVCAVKKTSGLSNTLKVYEPMDSMTKKSKKSGLAKMLASNQDVLKIYQEFYAPSDVISVNFLRAKLCVGSARGFEIISLDTKEQQSLLDQADTSLDFVQRKENVKPIHIERIGTEFLLCYTDYSFFVNRNGWRTRSDWIIVWEGTPTAFAIFTPYILAFEPNFIEIRHMDTGALMHIITAKNIRMLHSSSREVKRYRSTTFSSKFPLTHVQILYAYEDELGEDVVASLDFWGRPQSPGSNRQGESLASHVNNGIPEKEKY